MQRLLQEDTMSYAKNGKFDKIFSHPVISGWLIFTFFFILFDEMKGPFLL